MNESMTCEGCGKPLGPWGSVNLGSLEKGYRQLCLGCYNATVAEATGLDFQHADFMPMKFSDADGVEHEFHFGMRLTGNGVALDAHELRDGVPRGYQFQILDDDPEKEPLELLKLMMERIRRALSRRHLERSGEFGTCITDAGIVRATIDCDCDDPRYDARPLLIIDGQEITWEHFGRMLMSYEGWNFKLEIYDKSEER